MASIQSVRFHIIRDTYSAGSVCQIVYQYELMCASEETRAAENFSLWVELWGKDIVLNDPLGSPGRDLHTLVARPRITTERSFVVPCEELNEDLGKDEIFLRLYLKSSGRETIYYDSETIRERF